MNSWLPECSHSITLVRFLRSLSPAHYEFGFYEQQAITSRFCSLKWTLLIDINVQKVKIQWVPVMSTFLAPTKEVCEGYAFVGVCLFTGGGGVDVCLWSWGCGRHSPGQTPPGQRHPPGQTPCPVLTGIHPPAQCMLGYGQQAGGTHPTGMHSCCKWQTTFSVDLSRLKSSESPRL